MWSDKIVGVTGDLFSLDTLYLFIHLCDIIQKFIWWIASGDNTDLLWWNNMND